MKNQVNLFCDYCENHTEFDKVKVIERYDKKTKTFKKLTTEEEVYIVCSQCGTTDVIELDKELEVN